MDAVETDDLRALQRELAIALGNSALLTDLYQLNMMQAYLEASMTETAVFEFFVRKLPSERSFFVAAGIAQVVDYLRQLRFNAAELKWLKETHRFSEHLLDYLEELRFTGDVHGMPEGTVFFPDEPVIRITAPLPVAQLVETRIINLLHFESLIASKAARMVLAAPQRVLIDFGLRRAHGVEAGLLAARASYIAGFAGTATVPAAPLYGIPIFGTMAHSFIQAHDDEATAFEDFARARPAEVVLLIDTYDTEEGARKVTALASRLAADGITVRGVRIDSGDLVDHARKVRKILNDGGCPNIQIFASGGLDERDLLAFAAAEAPIDGYGIGTSLTTSSDVAALDCAYKLEEYAGAPRRKKSEGKETWPGRKQVFRQFDSDGEMVGDLLALDHETAEGEALIVPVILDGEPVAPPPSLEDIRAHAARNLAALPDAHRRLSADASSAVTVSSALREMADAFDREQAQSG